MSRRPVILLVLALAAGFLGYGLTRLSVRTPAVEAGATQAQLDWLAREFALSEATRAEVARLQAAYEPVCETHCAAIARAQADLRAAGPDSTARASAEAELARLKKACADATQSHLRKVAALMPPAEAKRFLAMMEPRVAHRDERVGAPALAPSDAP